MTIPGAVYLRAFIGAARQLPTGNSLAVDEKMYSGFLDFRGGSVTAPVVWSVAGCGQNIASSPLSDDGNLCVEIPGNGMRFADGLYFNVDQESYPESVSGGPPGKAFSKLTIIYQGGDPS